MALLVRNVSLRLHEPEEVLPQRIAKILNISGKSVRSYCIVRKALDARDHADIRRVYHVHVVIDGDEDGIVRQAGSNRVSRVESVVLPPLEPGKQKLEHAPVIVGTGPAGLFAGLLLGEMGYRPILLERGGDLAERHRALHLYYSQAQFDPQNNLLFGVGGAGTYSDGKLYSRTRDPRNSFVLEQLVRFGAEPEILIDAKPHIGSDKLPGICQRMIEHIRGCGGEIRCGARVIDLILGPRQREVVGLRLSSGQAVPISVCLLAIGHSARDTYRVLHKRGVELRAKPFQMGVRIEHPQELINRSQYGAAAAVLGPADYFLVAKNVAGAGDRCGPDLFSFCMCPGGMILPANESPEEICTNGASSSKRDSPFANSALVVTILPDEFNNDALLGIEYQRRWERLAFELSGSYAVPAQRVSDFLAGRKSDGELITSYPLGSRCVDLRAMLPEFLIAALEKGLPKLGRMIKGYASAEGILTGPETRASSPVRIVRDEVTRQSSTVGGLYPLGEGAGYSGGIVSSATDGLKSAEAVIRQYAPP